MTFHMNDREIKEKWLNKYKEEMNFHKEKMEAEKQKKLKEEQEYLDKVQREIEEEKARRREQKKMVSQENMEEYYKHLAQKQLEEIKNYESKLNSDSVSLNMGHEERVEKMKDYINQLSNKVDKNMDSYLNYTVNKKEFDSSQGNAIDHTYKPQIETNENYDYPVNNKQTNNFSNFNFNEPHPVFKNEIQTNFNNDNILDKIYGKNYVEYKKIQKNYDNYNKDLINDKWRSRENELYEKKKLNYDRLKEIERIKQLDMQDKMLKESKQRMYKELLDDQATMKNTLGGNVSMSPLVGTNRNFGNLSNSMIMGGNQANAMVNNYNNYDYGITNGNSHANLNNSYNMMRKVEIDPNPFKSRKYDLGYTILEHNTILNPVHNYRYNRYLYNEPGRSPNSNQSSLLNAGNHIMK